MPDLMLSLWRFYICIQHLNQASIIWGGWLKSKLGETSHWQGISKLVVFGFRPFSKQLCSIWFCLSHGSNASESSRNHLRRQVYIQSEGPRLDKVFDLNLWVECRLKLQWTIINQLMIGWVQWAPLNSTWNCRHFLQISSFKLCRSFLIVEIQNVFGILLCVCSCVCLCVCACVCVAFSTGRFSFKLCRSFPNVEIHTVFEILLLCGFSKYEDLTYRGMTVLCSCRLHAGCQI